MLAGEIIRERSEHQQHERHNQHIRETQQPSGQPAGLFAESVADVREVSARRRQILRQRGNVESDQRANGESDQRRQRKSCACERDRSAPG